MLEKELNSIYEVRERVHKLKRDLRESHRLENLYIEQSNRTFGANEDILLADDEEHEHLFHWF